MPSHRRSRTVRQSCAGWWKGQWTWIWTESSNGSVVSAVKSREAPKFKFLYLQNEDIWLGPWFSVVCFPRTPSVAVFPCGRDGLCGNMSQGPEEGEWGWLWGSLKKLSGGFLYLAQDECPLLSWNHWIQCFLRSHLCLKSCVERDKLFNCSNGKCKVMPLEPNVY